ncbi:MAG: hypothetical protein RQ862_02290 [Candidatus Caldarchaeales archaeon]|nr:hypothetical protein [Candidatus Caldarchaeales archaeon]
MGTDKDTGKAGRLVVSLLLTAVLLFRLVMSLLLTAVLLFRLVVSLLLAAVLLFRLVVVLDPIAFLLVLEHPTLLPLWFWATGSLSAPSAPWLHLPFLF